MVLSRSGYWLRLKIGCQIGVSGVTASGLPCRSIIHGKRLALKDIVDIVAGVVTTLAAVLAGGFAYYRFIKGRVFHPRFTVSAQARQLRVHTTDYLLSTLEVANVGLSRIDIDEATLRVCSLIGHATDAASAPDRVWLDTAQVMLAHTWIESGEKLTEQSLLTLPAGHSAPVLIDFRVVTQDVSLSASAIAAPAQIEGEHDAVRST